MKKYFSRIALVCLLIVGVYTFTPVMVAKAEISTCQLVQLLINIGIIAPNKADIALEALGCTIPPVQNADVVMSLANPLDTSVGAGGLVEIARVTVSAGSNNPIRINQIPLSMITTGAGTSAGTIAVRVQSTPVSVSDNIGAVGNINPSAGVVVFNNNGYDISAGSSVTFRFYDTVTLTQVNETSDALITKLGTPSLFKWTNVNENVIYDGSSILNYPTNSAVMAYGDIPQSLLFSIKSVPNSNLGNSFDYIATANKLFNELIFSASCNSSEVSIEAKGGMSCDEKLDILFNDTTQYSLPISFRSKDGNSHLLGMTVSGYMNGIKIGGDKDAITVYPVSTSTRPVITSISPTSGPAGSSITINGSGFNSGDSIHLTSGSASQYLIPNSITATKITFNLPAGIPPTGYNIVNISVHYGPVSSSGVPASGGHDSNSVIFTVTSTTQPSINVISPNGGEVWQLGTKQTVSINITGDQSKIVNAVGFILLGSSNNLSDGYSLGGFPIDNSSGLKSFQVILPSNVSYVGNHKIYASLSYTPPSSGTCPLGYLGCASAPEIRAYDYSDDYFTVVSSVQPSVVCTDSDGGDNIYQRGTIIGLSADGVLMNETDFCDSSNSLIEYVCSPDGIHRTNNHPSCPNGCLNGACLQTPIPAPEPPEPAPAPTPEPPAPTPNPTLSVTCSASPSTASVGQLMTVSASPSGGTGSYTYNWSDNQGNNSGYTSQSFPNVTYTTAGTKIFTVVVTSGTQKATATCSANVIAATPEPPAPIPTLSVTCSATPAGVAPNQAITVTAHPVGGTGSYTYMWADNQGNGGSTGIAGPASISPTYPTMGQKIFYVQVTSGTQKATGSCSAEVVPIMSDNNVNNLAGVSEAGTASQSVWQKIWGFFTR